MLLDAGGNPLHLTHWQWHIEPKKAKGPVIDITTDGGPHFYGKELRNLDSVRVFEYEGQEFERGEEPCNFEWSNLLTRLVPEDTEPNDDWIVSSTAIEFLSGLAKAEKFDMLNQIEVLKQNDIVWVDDLMYLED